MKKCLLFQSALPFSFPIIYAAAVHLSENSAVLVVLTIVMLVALVSMSFKVLRETNSYVFACIAGFSAISGATVGGAITPENPFYATAIFAIIYAVFAAWVSEVYLNSFAARLFYNFAWAAAIGFTAYFGFTAWGIVSFGAAVALPLVLLRHETSRAQ